MGIVKYTGPMASFHCPTNAEIRSLKVHFSPKQEGSGDPSPENVRPIVGWDGVEAYKSGKNIWDEQWEVGALNYTTGLTVEDSSRIRTKNFNPILPNTSYYFLDPTNGGNINVFWYDVNKTFIKISGWTGNIAITSPSNAYYFKFIMAASYGTIYNHNISINCPATDTFYEPHQGSTTNYEFGVLGKNKFNPQFNWTVGDTYRYIYLPELEHECIISFTRKNSSIDVSDISVGFSYLEPSKVAEINKGYRWCLSGGVIKSYIKTNTVFEPQNSEYSNQLCRYLVIYPRTQDVYDRLTSAFDIQIEFGSTATEYEPYNPKNIIYGGWIDLITGEAVEEYGFYTNTWGNGDRATVLGNNERRIFLPDSIFKAVGYILNPKCNIIKEFVYDSTRYNEDLSTYSLGNSLIYCKLPVNTPDSTILQFVGELKDPIHYFLIPTQLQTFLGQNNVWSNADYVEIEYDLHETQSILARKQFIIANQPHIVTPAAAPLQNFVTDLAAPLKECKVEFKPIQDLHGYDKPWVGGNGKNLFNNQYPDIDTSLHYISIYVGDSTVTVSTTCPWGYNGGAACLFALAGDVQSGASSDINGLSPTVFRTITPIDGYITIAYRIIEDIDPRNYNTQIELGSTATSYEPYENICPISGWTGVRIFQAGKNLMSDNHALIGAQFKNVDGNYEIGRANSYKMLSINVPKNTSLHIHKEIATGSELGLGNEIAYYGAPAVRIGSMTNYYNRDFNTGNYPYVYLMIGKDSTIDDPDRQWQIEIGNVATTYEAPKETANTVFDWTSAGTVYGGYVDLVKGEVVAKDVMFTVDATTPIASTTLRSNGVFRITYDLPAIGADKNALTSNLFALRERSSAANNYPQLGKISLDPYNTLTDELIVGAYAGVTTQAEWLAWLESNGPIQVLYELATPVTYPIDPVTLKTLRGTNNIWSNANGNIELKYWAH